MSAQVIMDVLGDRHCKPKSVKSGVVWCSVVWCGSVQCLPPNAHPPALSGHVV